MKPTTTEAMRLWAVSACPAGNANKKKLRNGTGHWPLTNHKVPAGEELPREDALVVLRGKFRVARVLRHSIDARKEMIRRELGKICTRIPAKLESLNNPNGGHGCNSRTRSTCLAKWQRSVLTVDTATLFNYEINIMPTKPLKREVQWSPSHTLKMAFCRFRFLSRFQLPPPLHVLGPVRA